MLQWVIVALGTVAVVGILGSIALIHVVDGHVDQAGWMRVVMDDGLGFYPVFFLVPGLFGVASTLGLRRMGLPFVVAWLGAVVIIAAYIWLLVALGTGHDLRSDR